MVKREKRRLGGTGKRCGIKSNPFSESIPSRGGTEEKLHASSGENRLHLTFSRGCIKKLLDNAKVVRLLKGNHADNRAVSGVT